MYGEHKIAFSRRLIFVRARRTKTVKHSRFAVDLEPHQCRETSTQRARGEVVWHSRRESFCGNEPAGML